MKKSLKSGNGLKPSRIQSRRKPRKKGELTKLKDKLWELCKAIIKQRHGDVCYTCGLLTKQPHPITGKPKNNRHTGHFITSSSCSVELRYDLKNLRPQCYECNINNSGEWFEFEQRLLKEFGYDYVDELKQRNAATKGKTYPKEWFIDKIQEYSLLLHPVENSLHTDTI